MAYCIGCSKENIEKEGEYCEECQMELKKSEGWMKQIKFFYGSSLPKMEKEFGDWIIDKEVDKGVLDFRILDIKFQFIGGDKNDGWEFFAVMVFYDERIA